MHTATYIRNGNDLKTNFGMRKRHSLLNVCLCAGGACRSMYFNASSQLSHRCWKLMRGMGRHGLHNFQEKVVTNTEKNRVAFEMKHLHSICSLVLQEIQSDFSISFRSFFHYMCMYAFDRRQKEKLCTIFRLFSYPNCRIILIKRSFILIHETHSYFYRWANFNRLQNNNVYVIGRRHYNFNVASINWQQLIFSLYPMLLLFFVLFEEHFSQNPFFLYRSKVTTQLRVRVRVKERCTRFSSPYICNFHSLTMHFILSKQLRSKKHFRNARTWCFPSSSSSSSLQTKHIHSATHFKWTNMSFRLLSRCILLILPLSCIFA